MSGACDNFILEDQSCEWFELVQYVESFDMGINFLEGPPGPPGPAGEAIFIPSVSEDGWISWTNTAGLPNPDPVYIKGPPGGGGSGDYDDLTDKPSINGVTLSGNKTTAELLISFSAADVGLGNVANERQYSAQNPPPYPVTSVAGKTGAVDLLPSDVGLGNVANERQYSAQNPPPYPVTSVAGKTGAVDLLPSDVGLGNVANERQYSSQNPPPYPVTSVAGKTGAVGLLPSDVGLGNVANERQYSAENPPPYPVTSVNGQTGAVVVSVPVQSVNGKTGTVVLDATDVGALPDDYTPPVTSVNGQTGAVVIETPSDIFNKELSSRCFGKGLSSSTIDFILYLPYIDVPYNIAFTNNEVNVADIGPSTVSIIHAKDTMCVYFRVSASGVTTNSIYVAGATFTLTKV